MSTQVEIGSITIGSSSNCTGIFSGQNMQNNWDSHGPAVGSRGAISGNHCATWTFLAYLQNETLIGQALLDQDYKTNESPMYIGP